MEIRRDRLSDLGLLGISAAGGGCPAVLGYCLPDVGPDERGEWMSGLGRVGAVLLATVFLALLAGCGETVIDASKTEGALEANLSKSLETKVSSVDCPSDVEVEPQATFTCSVELAGGKTETATLRILNEDADVSVIKLSGGNE
jgi:Domain of unknown function (DUF4333)